MHLLVEGPVWFLAVVFKSFWEYEELRGVCISSFTLLTHASQDFQDGAGSASAAAASVVVVVAAAAVVIFVVAVVVVVVLVVAVVMVVVVV